MPLVLLAVVAAYGSLSATVANVAVRAAPLRAQALAPWNGAITASAAQTAFLTHPSAEPGSRAVQLARSALMNDATAADALTVLGFQAQLRGDSARTGRLFAYSLALSRRELRPRLWAIEEAVSRGDIVGALASYDIALRTSREAPAILYPILTSALREPKIRTALYAVLDRGPAWREPFVAFAARNSRRPQDTAQFFTEGTRARLPITPGDYAALVNSLIAYELFPEAWTLYRRLRPDASQAGSRDPAFAILSDEPAVFDWTTSSANGLTASLGQPGGGVDFSAPASTGGVVLKQMQMLYAGSYRLEGAAEGIDQPEGSTPYWTLSCYNGQELGRVPVPISPDRTARFEGSFSIPEGCPVQTLALVLRPSEKVGGVAGRILRAKVTSMPAGAGRSAP